MKQLWNNFPNDNKPEWLTYEQILQKESKMLQIGKQCPSCGEKLKLFSENSKDESPLRWEWQCKCGYTGKE